MKKSTTKKGGQGRIQSLADELKKQKKELLKKASSVDVQRELMEVMKERVKPIPMFSSVGNLKIDDMMPLINAEMERVSEGCLRVPGYLPEQNTNQEVFMYVGTHWCKVENSKFCELVKECCRRMGLPQGKMSRAKFMADVYHNVMAHLAKSWSRSKPEGMAWLNLQNGTLEVDAEGKPRLREHRQEDCLLNSLPFAYDEKAESPLFQDFINRVLPDAECQMVLKEFVANALVGGAVTLQVMLILLGCGANGKSVLLEVIGALAGAENVSNISLSELTDDPNALLRFEHKLLNLSSESGQKWNMMTMKCLTSHETVMVKSLYQNKRETKDYGYMIAAMNELPQAEKTDAFYRRLKILPFKAVITSEEADPALAVKLKGQLPGILNWFLQGLPGLLRRQRLSQCKVCNDELQKYRMLSNSVHLFVTECCRSGGEVLGTTLFKEYKSFCEDCGVRNPVNLPQFYLCLESLNVPSFKRNHQKAFTLTLL